MAFCERGLTDFKTNQKKFKIKSLQIKTGFVRGWLENFVCNLKNDQAILEFKNPHGPNKNCTFSIKDLKIIFKTGDTVP